VLPLALFLLAAGLYAVTWIAIFAVHGPARLAMSLLNGFFIGVLFTVAHDACHGSFASRVWLNKAIGRLAMLPSLHSFSFWELGHNRIHHGWTNLKNKDYVWAPFAKEEFDELGLGRRMVERLGRTFFGVALYYAVVIWWSHMAFPAAEDRRRVDPWAGRLDRISALAFFVAQCVIGFVLEGSRGASHGVTRLVSSFLLAVALPFLMWNWLVGILTFVHHTHERARWYACREEWSFTRGVLLGTIHVVFPRAVDLILYNIMFHNAHHADTRIPLYRLPDAQRALEENYAKSVIQVRFAIGAVRETFRRCKLYDYRQHQWLDFAGIPTEAREHLTAPLQSCSSLASSDRV
jgi:omega-6 fatty acid desaturase (delta-12 desaturase)